MTIDLTSARPHVQIATPSRRILEAAARDRAIGAYRATRRRRFARGGIDSAADATMAIGAAILANMPLHLNWGLPRGAAGIALGISLIGIGAALALFHRRHGGDHDPASSAKPGRVIVLDQPSTVIHLDRTREHSVA